MMGRSKGGFAVQSWRKGESALSLGLYFDFRNPPQWSQEPRNLVEVTVDLVQAAESLGLGAVWFSEHHLFDDGYLSQPLTVAAAVAARTSRIEIGTSVTLPSLRHARHVAEQAALVQALSDGRLELGLGSGYRKPEFELFGVDGERPLGRLLEQAERVRSVLREDAAAGYSGGREVPIWLGVNGPAGAEGAGALGMGLLSTRRELLDPYLAGRRSGGYDVSGARMGGSINVFVTDHPERERAFLAPYIANQWDTYRRYAVEGTGKPVPSPIDVERWARPGSAGARPRFAVEDPDGAVRLIAREIQGLPVTHVYVWPTIPGLPWGRAFRSVALLAAEVLPALTGAVRDSSGGH
jgi:alkanesulfonate monooxygenase SsuD/methylene tetrahydromethanopterin reductase-like flavin-dependent oxidoreductase (luciferase family)